MDASFAFHPDFKGHNGAIMTMGQGVVHSVSRKQKPHSSISTEDELVAVDDASV